MATLTSKDQLTTPSTSSNDDYLKRNTDCVYFLASPLTCKKGSECEYRHSEYARLNPRDCIYWMNGNCLNPRCAFRHPPLDGLVGPQAGSCTGPCVPGPPAPAVPHNTAKQAIPCIFFQKGYCLKGDRCPFLHGPSPASAKVQQVSANTPVAQPLSVKPTFGALEKCTQPKINIQTNTSKKVVEKPVQVNGIANVQTSRPTNGVPSGRFGCPPRALVEDSSKYKEKIVPPIDNSRSKSRSALVTRASSLGDSKFQNGRDADNTLRESSPGFDVLVDDKLRNDEYYENEDQFVRMRARDQYDDYDSVVDVDPDLYHKRRGHGSYDHVQERYARERHRASSERSSGEPTQYDRRGSYKSESPDFVQSSDLRRCLSKQRRVNGLKSVVNPDYNRDNHFEDRSYRSTHRETHRSPNRESSCSSRLQGRIKLPSRSPPVGGSNMFSETGHGRLRDRLRVNEDSDEGRTSQGFGTRRESFNENNMNFAAPKSLAELKGSKQTDSKPKHQQPFSGGKVRDTVLVSSVGHEGDLLFDGPKPLSEILKRKRDVVNKENKKNQNNEDLISSNADSAADTKKQIGLDSVLEQEQGTEVEDKPVTAGGDKEEVEVLNKKMKMAEGEGLKPNEERPDIEEGLNNVVQGELLGDEHDQEQEQVHDEEEYDQGDGEYEYEQYDGEGYDLNEGETIDDDNNLMDEDDGDDFAKKIGVSF